jgi:hypothetical protein
MGVQALVALLPCGALTARSCNSVRRKLSFTHVSLFSSSTSNTEHQGPPQSFTAHALNLGHVATRSNLLPLANLPTQQAVSTTTFSSRHFITNVLDTSFLNTHTCPNELLF